MGQSMNNQALIFFDIDGTLLDHDKKLPSSTKKAIEQLHADGHIVAIATGRGPFMYKKLRDELKINSFVSYNGSYVVIDGKVVYKQPLNKNALIKLTQEGLEKGHPAVFLTPEGMHSNVEHHSFMEESLATLKLDVEPTFEPVIDFDQNYLQTLFFIEDKDEAYYKKQYPEFEFVRWHPLSVDVLPQGGSKAVGIQAAIEALNIKPEHVYAFGDGLNDIQMLKTVHNSVAMGNGEPEVKEVAKYVTKNVDQDGILYGLKMVGLL